MRVSINRGTQKWMVYHGKSYQIGSFRGTSILGNFHTILYITLESRNIGYNFIILLLPIVALTSHCVTCVSTFPREKCMSEQKSFSGFKGLKLELYVSFCFRYFIVTIVSMYCFFILLIYSYYQSYFYLFCLSSK